MLIVGITGGIGSGKSAVTRELEQLGIEVVDADIVARDVVKPGEKALEDITAHFGNHLLTSAGDLNRAALRTLIFDDPAARKWLEERLHPIILKQISINSQIILLLSMYLKRYRSHAQVHATATAQRK